MLFSQMNPYVRYGRYLNINEKSHYKEVVPLDARLFYALDGYSKIKADGVQYDMGPNSLLIINSGIPYQLLTPSAPANYIAINFDYTQNAAVRSNPIIPVAQEQFKPELLVEHQTFEDVPALSGVLYIPEISAIQKKLRAVVKEYMQKLLYFEQKTSHMLAECIAESMRFSQIGSVAHDPESPNRILAYIHYRYSENLTNISIGKQFGYHPNYVSFLIKHVTGMPVHKYVIHVRLMNAKIMLENSDLSVSEIAAACGFCDLAYFSACFKQHFGISPSKYRNV